jgi:hypothetical protein
MAVPQNVLMIASARSRSLVLAAVPHIASASDAPASVMSAAHFVERSIATGSRGPPAAYAACLHRSSAVLSAGVQLAVSAQQFAVGHAARMQRSNAHRPPPQPDALAPSSRRIPRQPAVFSGTSREVIATTGPKVGPELLPPGDAGPWGTALVRVRIEGGPAEIVRTNFSEYPGTIAVDDACVYWSRKTGVERMKKP